MRDKNTNSLNEELKKRELEAREKEQEQSGEQQPMALDDTQRVKVLSPGKLVTKRFLRNKLAIIGLCILIFMFAFAFLGPLFYPYTQTEIFYTYKPLNINYASAKERTEVVAYTLDADREPHYSVTNRLNSYISEMEQEDATSKDVTGTDGLLYRIDKLGDHIYTLSNYDLNEVAVFSESAAVAKYNKLDKTFEWTGEALDSAFTKAATAAITGKEGEFTVEGVPYMFSSSVKNQYEIKLAESQIKYTGSDMGGEFAALVEANVGGSFEFGGQKYNVTASGDGSYAVLGIGDATAALLATTYVFDAYEAGTVFSEAFIKEALLALNGSGSFEYDGETFNIADVEGEMIVSNSEGSLLASLSTFVVRRYSGQDTLTIEFKNRVEDVITEMIESNRQQGEFVFSLPEMDEEANYITDANGNYSYVDTNLTVTRKGNSEYVVTCEQLTYLIDIYSSPSEAHAFGTDGDGMDILARMMYGGRISLMVGFVVVIMESVLGIIMGGVAGYFGGWADTLIMRLVDIFYCIPTYPILIIMGAFFDAIKMDPYERLMYLMVILGVLGWAGIARLVRGQILSFREQEFMIAQEATGMKPRTRIMRHLIPNVMPQLIVNATMGLGSVIITESTLSFLGLGVKHPLATWGTMINSVTSSSESMIKYTYIWVPVGLLICLTVIAFNFVGDGLRDAFDPKMKQ